MHPSRGITFIGCCCLIAATTVGCATGVPDISPGKDTRPVISSDAAPAHEVVMQFVAALQRNDEAAAAALTAPGARLDQGAVTALEGASYRWQSASLSTRSSGTPGEWIVDALVGAGMYTFRLTDAAGLKVTAVSGHDGSKG